MAYDNKEYENVKSRKQRFYASYPDGRIIATIENDDLEIKAVVKATIFLNKEDQMNDLPRSVGYALEIRDTELSRSNSGKTYESVNYSSWLENCEESAVGRALDNGGYGSNTCSKEELDKAKRLTEQYKKQAANNPPITLKPNVTDKNLNVNLDHDVVKFGKFKGKAMSDIPLRELTNYADYLSREAADKNEELKFGAKDFVEKVKLIVNKVKTEVKSETKKEVAKNQVPTYANEDIPPF